MTEAARIPLHIYLVEDNDDDVFLIRKAVAQAPWPATIDTAVHGEAVLNDLNSRCEKGLPLPDLILLDINMPRLDGFQVLKAVKEDTRLRHLPLLVLTTSDRREDIQRAFGLGASSFFTKPADFDGLVELLERILIYWCSVTALPNAG